MLKVEHVSKRYERKHAVDDLSFEIPAGHICGFIGPNGAGKSTTMNMITGYLPATSGTITIDGLDVRPDMALIDGNRDHGSTYAVTAPHVTIVGGDGKSASIAAASILAKVSRDRYVSTELDALYPQYQFTKHKGYGTKLHYQMLDQYGPCPAHRVTFLKKWEARKP